MITQLCCDMCGMGIDGEQYCGDCWAAEVGKGERLGAEVARLRGILDLVDSVDECGVMHPPHVVIDMIRDALAGEVPR